MSWNEVCVFETGMYYVAPASTDSQVIVPIHVVVVPVHVAIVPVTSKRVVS